MKKLFAVLLSLAMIFALATTAFAAESTSLTIENANGHEYDGYKLLNLTSSLKDGDTCIGDHNPDCYNYAYSVNEKYLEILQAEVFANGTTAATIADDVTETEIIDYLAAQTRGNGTLRTVADRVYLAIVDAGITPDADDLTGNNDTIDQGYWMIADVTDLDGEEDANSLVMVDTKGLEALTITPKTGLPTIEKKVKDITDSTDADITDNAWQDSADHDVTDVVPFKLTATLPENLANYTEYMIAFHDQLSSGLTLDATSIKVYMYEDLEAAEDDVALANAAADVTDAFTANTNPGDGCTFDVTCDDILEIDGVDKDTVFVVYYEATLNETAVMGEDGNPNEAYLEFSNNPYTDGTGETEKDKVIVFTYQVVIEKTDAEGNPLAGAGFTLYKMNSNGEYVAIGAEQGGEGSTLTQFSWLRLDDGNYKLVESTVPAGYNGIADIEFEISAEHDEESAAPALTSLSGGALGTGVVETGLVTYAVINRTGTILPETGAEGTFLLITGGALLAALAAVFMITRKKMSVYED